MNGGMRGMDTYDYAQTDKVMSYKLDAIYSNPARHKFYSCFDFHRDSNTVGRRGGKVTGLKRTCWHCGQKKKGHAEKDEQV
jgi:hypothetical protein